MIDKDIERVKELQSTIYEGGEYIYLNKNDKQALGNVLKELETKDKKLKDIERHIEAEIMMIEKCYNEVDMFSKQQYDGMMASYKCLLNVFFTRKEVEK